MRWTKKLTFAFMIFIIVVIILLVGALLLIKNPDVSDTSIDKLKTLPYIDWHPVKKKDLKKIGVTLYETKLAFNGLNIYNYPDPLAYLIDMSGKILHEWNYGKKVWHHVEMDENGDLLSIIRNRELVKLDWESRVKWISKGRYHHDVAIAENGDIYAIKGAPEYIDYKSYKIPILNDLIIILSIDGQIKKKISVYNLFGKEIDMSYRKKIFEYVKDQENQGIKVKVKTGSIFDVFHTNTIEIIEKDIGRLAKKGDVLVCLRNLNKIAIIDLTKEEIVWSLKEVDLDMPHQPTVCNGRISLFDNGLHRKYSRVLEIDPYLEQIVWEYKGNPERSFFSGTRGGIQRLPNGNTLITESNKAHVFEVTKNKEIVWEFYGTKVNIKSKKRKSIYRMTRIDPNSLEDIILKKIRRN